MYVDIHVYAHVGMLTPEFEKGGASLREMTCSCDRSLQELLLAVQRKHGCNARLQSKVACTNLSARTMHCGRHDA